MLKIRLRRVGARKQPSYRIVIAESTAPRDGKFVENIGFYNPRTDPETVRIHEDRALHWLSVGAQPTESVARIFRTHGTMDRFERLRAGESLNTLVAEASASEAAASEAAASAAVAAPEPVEVVEEPEAEVEIEAEAEIETEAEAEAETEAEIENEAEAEQAPDEAVPAVDDETEAL